MDLAFIFVGPGAVSEEPPYGGIHFAQRRRLLDTGHRSDARGKFITPPAQILGDVIEDLRAVMCCRLRPGLGGAGCCYRIADVLAVAFADLAQNFSPG